MRLYSEFLVDVGSPQYKNIIQTILMYCHDPNEGDLLYLSVDSRDLYEIKFVNKENPFYQFGEIQFFKLTAEII